MKQTFIELQEASCHNCMRCVRACPTNAMTYLHRRPEIVADDCLLCGQCYVACPHDAKKVPNDLKKIEGWLKNGEQVIVSVAPSFLAVWDNFSSLEKALKKKGFFLVEETAVGAAAVSHSYAQLIADHEMKNIISTACPVVNTLVRREYGDLTQYLAPVVSPLIAHGRLLKEKYPDAKVVFLTPCIAKMKEIQEPENAGAVDVCLSVEDAYYWLKSDIGETDQPQLPAMKDAIARMYPTPGGIINTLAENSSYQYINVEGIDRIRRALDAMRDGHLSGYFVEMSACNGSCFGGPLLQKFQHNEWRGQAMIRKSVNMQDKLSAQDIPAELKTEWEPDEVEQPVFTEEEIQQTLINMGKTSPDKIHDCGACGYATCRKKAIAVLEGRADPTICLPEAVAQAQSLANSVIRITPNGIIIVDDSLTVKEMNPAARRMLKFEMNNPTGMPLGAVLPDEVLLRLVQKIIAANSTKTETLRSYYDMYQKLFDHAIVRIADEHLVIIILMDRTDEEIKEKMLAKMRDRTMDVTQQVINDQMRTVQEIASLLGETTAKSKVAMTKLQRVMRNEDDDDDE